MQRELRGERALEAYGHIRTRLCDCQFAELFRVKLVKRQMYGRGKLDLLQARMLGANCRMTQ